MFEAIIVVAVVLGGLLILLWVASNALKLELFPDLAGGFSGATTAFQESIGGAFTNAQRSVAYALEAPVNVFKEKQRDVAYGFEKAGGNLTLVLNAPANLVDSLVNFGKKKKEWDPMAGSWAQSLSEEEFLRECEKYGVDPHPEFSEPQVLTTQEKEEIKEIFVDPLERRAVLRSEELWA